MDNISGCLDNLDRLIVDRIEAGVAVMENATTLEIIMLPISSLPPSTKPGDTLVNKNGHWYFDYAETEARKQRINTLFAKIKANNNKSN